MVVVRTLKPDIVVSIRPSTVTVGPPARADNHRVAELFFECPLRAIDRRMSRKGTGVAWRSLAESLLLDTVRVARRRSSFEWNPSSRRAMPEGFDQFKDGSSTPEA